MIMAQSLFSCTRCHRKFPLTKLSSSLMQCSGCLGGGDRQIEPSVCTYCREGFSGISAAQSICPKCQSNVKQYGKPSACQICNVIAAFIGSKCKRCVVSESKWGPPINCEQCKQKCAFNRDEHSKKKVDDKVLCWLCTIAFKRVLSKAKKREGPEQSGSGPQAQKRADPGSVARSITHTHRSANSNGSSPSKKAKTSVLNLNGSSTTQSATENISNAYMHDMNIVLITQLRENVESLKKSLAAKEKELFDKERKMTEFKTIKMETDKAHREKIASMQTNHNRAVEALQQKNNELLKQIATLSKSSRRGLVASAPGSRSGSPASRN